MSDDTTTTDAPVSDGAPAQDVSAEAQPTTTESAEAVQETATESSDTNVSEPSDDTRSWAEKKGFNLDNPEDVAKLANSYREAEKKMHESSQQASELKNVIQNEASAQGVPEDQVQAMNQQLQVLQANQAVNDFYAANPDARKYDAEMAKIVQENPAIAAGGIEALYALAKVRDLESGGEQQIKDEGKKEGLQTLALKQKVASATASATSSQTSSPSITQADVASALQRGDREWLQNNKAAIDAL